MFVYAYMYGVYFVAGSIVSMIVWKHMIWYSGADAGQVRLGMNSLLETLPAELRGIGEHTSACGHHFATKAQLGHS